MAVAGALAELAEVAGEHERAIRFRLRVLECDPYDEPAHLALVESLASAGRHGGARRSYRRYLTLMGEISVNPAPFPRRQRALSPP